MTAGSHNAMRVLLLGVLTASCVDPRDSEGSCTGRVMGALDGKSEFHRVELLLDTDAYFQLRYAGGALIVDGHIDGMPSGKYIGSHPIFGESSGTNEFMEGWDVTSEAGDLPTVSRGTITFTKADYDRLVGSFEMSFTDETQVQCGFDLRRDLSKDSD